MPFKDIAEMQARNAQLMRALRQLGEDHEAELARREGESEGAVAARAAHSALPTPCTFPSARC